MIIVASGAPVFDCYVQRVLIQMGLLKSIKYLIFDGASLNGIVDRKNEHFGVGFMGFTSGSFEQT